MKIVDRAVSEVIIFDDLAPEAAAMVLAMYSRDPRSVRIHHEQVLALGPQKFMDTYYVGYGHKSIGDCGSTTICGELVSMLVAKAVQQNPLYCGQEASTRYLDFAEQPVLNPLGTTAGSCIQETWMHLYAKVLKVLVPHLMKKFPMLASDNPKIYSKAILAKAFDISRAFLPAGCTTYVGWHGNLRQIWDHLKDLSFHPLEEVRNTASSMLEELRKKYPSSFGFKSYPEQDKFLSDCAKLTYTDLQLSSFVVKNNLDMMWLAGEEEDMDLLYNRPPRTELPDRMTRYGNIRFRFPLDFGSFRDLQRHRSCTQIMPLLSTRHGMHPWYIQSLPEILVSEVEHVLAVQEAAIRKIADPIIRQYYVAMGYQVMCEVTAALPSTVYIAELRSSQAVHPTLRPIAQKMGQTLRKIIPGIAIHCDMNADEWSTLRGKHDIVRKD